MYRSVRQAATAIGIHNKTLLDYEKAQQKKGINTPYKNTIKILRGGPGGPRGKALLDKFAVFFAISNDSLTTFVM